MTDEVEIVGYVDEKRHLIGRVISKDGICFTLMAMTHGWGQGYVIEFEEEEK